MDRARLVTHGGKRIVLVDLSALTDIAEITRWIARGRELVHAQPPASVRYCLDVTGMRFDTSIVKRFRENGETSRPYLRAAAIVGLSGIQRAAYVMIAFALKLHMPDFPEREQALDWLAAQP
jgi:hypothetical protein